jgi:hypothetical protein
MVEDARKVFVKPDDPTPIKCIWCGEPRDYFQADVREWKVTFAEIVKPL